MIKKQTQFQQIAITGFNFFCVFDLLPCPSNNIIFFWEGGRNTSSISFFLNVLKYIYYIGSDRSS